jgi:hypothetical protein
VPFDASAACATFGQFGAYLFDGERLCAECYGKRGSCCHEFEPHDVVRMRDEKLR